MQSAFPTLWPFILITVFGSQLLPTFGELGLAGLFVASLMFIVGALISFSQVHILRNKLSDELRRIACAPIPARSDKRFKGWDPRKIYAPGVWGDLELRPAVPTKPRGRQRRSC